MTVNSCIQNLDFQRISPNRRAIRENVEVPEIKLLVVEDEPGIRKLLQLHLEELHADVVQCDDGAVGLELATQASWDLILLDIQLPNVSGLDICKKLRSSGDQTPILMLTAKISELDRVLGLELGADDYVSKPFSPVELIARIRALLRRSAMTNKAVSQVLTCKTLALGNIEIDTQQHTVTADNQQVELTAKEFELLLLFMQNPGQVFRRSELLDQVWGYNHTGYEHTVNSHINRLRKKIEINPAEPVHITTVWGIGYKFEMLA